MTQPSFKIVMGRKLEGVLENFFLASDAKNGKLALGEFKEWDKVDELNGAHGDEKLPAVDPVDFGLYKCKELPSNSQIEVGFFGVESLFNKRNFGGIVAPK